MEIDDDRSNESHSSAGKKMVIESGKSDYCSIVLDEAADTTFRIIVMTKSLHMIDYSAALSTVFCKNLLEHPKSYHLKNNIFS